MSINLADGLRLNNPERPHDPGVTFPLPATLLVEWPRGTFVENLLPKRDGAILVSLHSTGELVQVDPYRKTKSLVHQFPASCGGVVEVDGSFYINVGNMGETGAALYRLDPDGSVEKWVDVPDALFLNGNAVLSDGLILSVDSIVGTAFLIDVRARTVARWLSHESLRKVSDEAFLPGVNGVKVFRDYVYFSNTDSARIMRAKVQPDGSAGSLEMLEERLNSDDFAFDTNGAIYFCTHLGNSVMRLLPDGTRQELAGAQDGFAGSTAAAFGRHPEQRGKLFVTATGGILEPYQGRVETGKLLVIDVGVDGAPITWP